MSNMAELARAIIGGGSSPRSSEHMATVIRRGSDGVYWVHIPGGADETPISSFLTEASEGDTVRVKIDGGKAVMTGNVTSPSANVRTVTKVGGVANKALTTAYEESARIDKLQTSMLTADSAIITDLQAETAKVEDLTASQLNATVGYIEDLTTGNVSASNIVADHGTVGSLTANSITAQQINAAAGYVNTLTSSNVTAANLVADHATVGSLNVEQISADHATVGSLSTTYAQIDAANITQSATQNAWVDKLLVQTGLIANDGAIFTLDAVKVNAANITAGTLDVERLVVTDSTTGDKHLVTWNSSTQSYDSVKLDGDVLGDNTVAADKIVANSITTSHITTRDLEGTNGWINLASGTFSYGNTALGDGISWDGSQLVIKTQNLEGVIESINLSAGSATIDASKININGVITAGSLATTADVDAIQVGGRNLLAIKDFITVANGPDAIDLDGWCTDSTPTGDSRAWGYASSNWKLSLDVGTYTLSWDVKTASTSTSSGYAVYSSGGTQIAARTSGTPATFSASGSKTFSLSSATDVGIIVKVYGGKVRFKLERGNKATDWTPAPEDIESSANSQEQLIYIQAVSGTSSMSGTTTWVVATGESVTADTAGLTPAWTTKRPTYRTNYPVLFVATQRKAVDGTVTCTTPIIDDTVTVIDGGHIITNSITAEKLDVNNINASNSLTVGAFTSDTQVNLVNVGDNLLRFTGDPTYVYIRTYYEDGMEPLGWYSYTSNSVYERTADGLKFTRHASASDGFVVPLVSEDSVESGVEYTISCEYRTNNASTGTIYLLCRNTPNLTATGVTLDSSGEWAKFEQTVSWTIADNKKPYALLFPYFGGDGKWFEVKRGTLKMEKGSSATPWVPASSDYAHPLDNSQPNLCPYLSIPVTDTSYWLFADGRGEPVSSTEGIDQVENLEDGWAHVLLDARSESGNENKTCYLNLQIAAGKLRDKIKPGKTYTWMIEVKNLTITSGQRLCVYPSVGNTTYDIFTSAFYQGNFTQDGVQYVPVKSFDEFPQDNRDTRGYIYVTSGTYAECDVRVSLYEGVYTGLYKPYSGELVYVPATSNSGIAAAVQQIYIQSESYGVDMPSGWVRSYAESVPESVNLLVGTSTGLEMSANVQNIYSLSSLKGQLEPTTQITLKFRAKSSVDGRWIDFYWQGYNNTNNFYPAFQLTDDWVEYSYTGVAGTNVASATNLRLRQSSSEHGSAATGATINLEDVRLYVGTDERGWMPAPEDDAPPEWTAKRPTFNPGYPLIYTATQTMMLDGTVETTTPVLDDTMTVIDGGSIITGSVTANALAANSVQVGNLSQDVSDLIAEAAKTATGYLAYDGNALTIGEQNSPIKAKLTNTKFSFMGGDEGNTELAYMGQNPDTNAWETVFDQARVSDMLFFGGFAWIKRDNGNMSLKWVG